MRIAIYIRTVKSARGAERVSGTIAKGLAELGHDIDFLIEEPGGQVCGALSCTPGITMVNLRESKVDQVTHRFWQLLATARALLGTAPGRWRQATLRMVAKNDPPVAALRNYALTKRPDAILSFLNYPNLSLLLVAPLLPRQTALLVSVRNHMSTAAEQANSKWVRSIPRLMRRFFRHADRVIAPSQGVADDTVKVAGIPASLVEVIPNPVFRPKLLELANADAGHPWFRDASVPVIVAAGKLKPQKDFATLLDAFARLRISRPARLVILGEGPERIRLEQLADELGISDACNLVGDRDNPYPFMAGATVFALSSAWEGLPNVLIEALACGCPVVATDCPSGPAEILENGRYGLLVPVGDSERLAVALETVIADPPPAEHQLARARDFAADRVIGQYAKMIASVVESARQ